MVVSQFEKTGTINFSVRAYSTLPFSLEKIKNPWRHKEEVGLSQIDLRLRASSSGDWSMERCASWWVR